MAEQKANRIELSERIRQKLNQLETARQQTVMRVSQPFQSEMVGIVRGYLEGKDIDTDATDFHVADDLSHVLVVAKSGIEQEGEGTPPQEPSEPKADPAAREAIAAEARN